MNFYWLLTLLIFNDVCGFKKCPEDCICNLDITNRKQMLCNNSFFKSDAINLIDNEIQVVVIKIAYTFLSELSTLLQPFKKLEQLRIIDSNLSTLGKYTFWGLPNIQFLDLSRNNISIIVEDNFRGQDNLLELDLSKNKIFKIPSNLFHYLKSLKTLRLDENFLQVLHDRPFYKLTNLQYLNLCGNSLQDLPPEVFKDIQELKILKCRRCQLKNINPQLYNLLNNLLELDLGDNQFKYLLRDEYNDLKKLKILKLDGNQLSVIVDYIFYNQNNLEYLDISHNRLAKITNYAFFNLTNLKYLDLSYNKLTKLEVMSVKPLVKLEILNISGNTALELSEIRPTFQVLQDLSQVSLSDMGVMPVGLLMPLGHLETLNLSGNQLDDSSLKILNPIYNLKFLDLSRNQLNGIDHHIALKLIKIHDVRLENNPLVCDKCHMGPIIQQGSKLKWHSQSICFLPERLRGFYINEINYEELDECIEFSVDEDHDAASTSYNFLDQRLGPIIVFGGIVFIITCGIAFAIVMCYTKSSFSGGGGSGQKQFSLIDQTDNVNIGKLQNQQISLSTSSGDIRIDEKHNVKYSLETSICTIDEIFIPEPPPPPVVTSVKKTVQFKDD